MSTTCYVFRFRNVHLLQNIPSTARKLAVASWAVLRDAFEINSLFTVKNLLSDFACHTCERVIHVNLDVSVRHAKVEGLISLRRFQSPVKHVERLAIRRLQRRPQHNHGNSCRMAVTAIKEEN